MDTTHIVSRTPSSLLNILFLVTLPPFLLSLLLFTPSFSAHVSRDPARSSSTWAFTLCLCVCSSSPFPGLLGASAWDLGVFRIFESFSPPICMWGYKYGWMKIACIIAHKRNNVVVLFGTLKVQSFLLRLTEVRERDLLIVVTSSTFLKRKDMLKEKNN